MEILELVLGPGTIGFLIPKALQSGVWPSWRFGTTVLIVLFAYTSWDEFRVDLCLGGWDVHHLHYVYTLSKAISVVSVELGAKWNIAGV